MRTIIILIVLGVLSCPAQEVGEFGHVNRIHAQGNNGFTISEIRSALVGDLDYVLASHPRGSLENLLTVLTQRVTAGYLAHGYPEVLVTTKRIDDHIQLVIEEGKRYHNGKIRIHGNKQVDEKVLMDWLTKPHPKVADLIAEKKKSEDELVNKEEENLEDPIFKLAEPANFHESFNERIVRQMIGCYLTNGYLGAQAIVTYKKTEDLHVDIDIEITSEGSKPRLGQVIINGLNKTPKDEIKKIAHITDNMPVNGYFAQKVQSELIESGRFPVVVAELKPTGDSTIYDLQIAIEESIIVPTAPQALSQIAQTVLKGRVWLLEWLKNGGEDLYVNWHIPQGEIEMVMSPTRGLLFTYDIANDNERIRGGISFDKNQWAYFSGPQKRIATIESSIKFTFNVAVTGIKQKDPLAVTDSGSFNFQVGFDKNNKPANKYVWNVIIEPNTLLSQAYDPMKKWLLEDNKLSLEFEGKRYDIIDQASGKILPFVSAYHEDATMSVSFLAQKFDQVQNKMREQSSGQNQSSNHVGQKPSSTDSLIDFSNLLLSDLLKTAAFYPEKDTNGEAVREQFVSSIQSLQIGLGFLLPLLPKELPKSEHDHHTCFCIPPNFQAGVDFAGLIAIMSAKMSGFVLENVPINHWSHVLFRGVTSVLLNKTEFIMHDLRVLTEDNGAGPIGCLVIGAALKLMKPELSTVFCELGQERLRLADFIRDVEFFHPMVMEAFLQLEQPPDMSLALANLNTQNANRIASGIQSLYDAKNDKEASKSAYLRLVTIAWEIGLRDQLAMWLQHLQRKPAAAQPITP